MNAEDVDWLMEHQTVYRPRIVTILLAQSQQRHPTYYRQAARKMNSGLGWHQDICVGPCEAQESILDSLASVADSANERRRQVVADSAENVYSENAEIGMVVVESISCLHEGFVV